MRCAATVAAAILAATPVIGAEAQKKSGLDYVSADTKALQADDFANPGMLWVLDGENLWKTKAGAADKSCADCHEAAPKTMKGVATRYPAFDETTKQPIDLQGRINQCRKDRQAAEPLALEGRELLALTTYVAHQSRGMPIAPPKDARLTPFIARGEALYNQRIGQLDLSCANCHDERAGEKLAGNLIPQAHPTGYPLYRLEWQAVGSLQRRLRGCMTGVRSDTPAYGSAEFVELELFLMSRAAPLVIETPAVRP